MAGKINCQREQQQWRQWRCAVVDGTVRAPSRLGDLTRLPLRRFEHEQRLELLGVLEVAPPRRVIGESLGKFGEAGLAGDPRIVIDFAKSWTLAFDRTGKRVEQLVARSMGAALRFMSAELEVRDHEWLGRPHAHS